MIDTTVPVVVVNLGDHGSLGIARTLGRLGVAVHGVAVGGVSGGSSRTPASRSRYFRSVRPWMGALDSPAFVDFLCDLGRAIGGRPVLVPTGDLAALVVEDDAERLASQFRFPRQPAGLARRLSSKRGMYELCVQHGIPTPQTVFPQERGDVERYASDGIFPVMLKAIDNFLVEERGVSRMQRAENGYELLEAYDELEDPRQPNLMIQELIPGGPEQVWMFNGYFDAESTCLVGFTGQKLRQCPPATGSTSLGICHDNEDVFRTTTGFMRALGYRGVLDCGYRFDARDGQYKLLDVNPRVGATFRLFVGDEGTDVVRALYLDLTDQPVPETHPVDGRKWVVENNDIISFVRGRHAGGPGAGAWLRSFRGVDEAAWWSTDDPMPFVGIAGKSLGSAARKVRALGGRVAGRHGREQLEAR